MSDWNTSSRYHTVSVHAHSVGDWRCRAGIDLATVEVRMNQLKVEANIAVGSRGNPTVTNTVLNIADVRLCPTHYSKLCIS